MKASEFLEAAIGAMESRAKERDKNEERSMARTVEAFNTLLGHALSERDGWLFMAILKIARAGSTPTGTEDDYIDMAAYAGLAGESVQAERLPKFVKSSVEEIFL